MNKKEVVYMVTYKDDKSQQHLTFVQKYSDVKSLEERYGGVQFEATSAYHRENIENGFDW